MDAGALNKNIRLADYFFSRLLGEPLCPPEHVYCSLTNACNLRCSMCSIPHDESASPYELSYDEWCRVIDDVAAMGIGHIVFSGGEPLLRPDIADLVSYSARKKIPMVDIISNGLLLTESLTEQLVAAGLHHITISIDGMTETHDCIRGRGSFQKASAAIDMINTYQKNGFPTVGINYTIMDSNVCDIMKMFDFARSKKCNVVLFQPVLVDNTDMQVRSRNLHWVRQKNILLLEQQMKHLLDAKSTVQDIVINVDRTILKMIPAYFRGETLDQSLRCYEALVRMVITSAGDVWSCYGTYGSVRHKRLPEIWTSREAAQVRAQVRECARHCLQSCIYFPGATDIFQFFNEYLDQTADTPALHKSAVQTIRGYMHDKKARLQKKIKQRFSLMPYLCFWKKKRCSRYEQDIYAALTHIDNWIKRL